MLNVSFLQMIEEQRLKSLTGSINTMQHVLEEAGRLLKLVWRVSVPAGSTAGDGGNNQQVHPAEKTPHQILRNPFNYLWKIYLFKSNLFIPASTG